MSDLFDYAARAKASENLKREGMARSAANATPDWSAFMLEQVRLVCLEQRRFTSDDVMDRADADPNAPQTHDLRALGPVMTRASKLGYCRKADVAPMPSRRESLHNSPRSVWDSLL